MSEEQFRQFFEANFNGLYVYAFTLLKNQAEAKDIVQASFIKLWEKRVNVREPEQAKAFLYKVVFRLSLNAIRNQKTRERHYQQFNDRGAVAPNTSEEKEIRSRIYEAVSELPERCREVFLKVRMEGMKYREVAKEMDISEKTVETQMLRAMKFIRQRLGDLIVAMVFLVDKIANM